MDKALQFRAFLAPQLPSRTKQVEQRGRGRSGMGTEHALSPSPSPADRKRAWEWLGRQDANDLKGEVSVFVACTKQHKE